jgi:hypothetical protein
MEKRSPAKGAQLPCGCRFKEKDQLLLERRKIDRQSPCNGSRKFQGLSDSTCSEKVNGHRSMMY